MKQIRILLLVIIAASFYNKAVAQNNLQFNAAKYVTLSGVNSNTAAYVILDTVNITVPTGKLWKIESADAASSGSCQTYC